MYCTNCGTEINDSATFCKNCGFSTDNSPESNHQNNLSGAADVQVKKTKRKIIILSIIAAILIVAVGIGVFMKTPLSKDDIIKKTAETYFKAVGTNDYSLMWDTTFPEDIEKEIKNKYGNQKPPKMLEPSVYRKIIAFEVLNSTPLTANEIKEGEDLLNERFSWLMSEKISNKIDITEAYGLNVRISFQTDGNSETDIQDTNCVVYKANGDWCCIVF